MMYKDQTISLPEEKEIVDKMNISSEINSSVGAPPKRSVRFDHIDLIELAVVLGDNPSLSTGGPPMSVGWEQVRRSQYALDEYEQYRPPKKQTRREMIVSKKGRTKFFLRCGYTLDEIEEAAAIALNYRNQMTITKILYPEDVMEDAAKDRFSSTPDCEVPRARMRRRYSSDPMISSSDQRRRRLSNDPINRRRMPRRNSIEVVPRQKRMARRLSNEPLAAPTRAQSPRRESRKVANSQDVASYGRSEAQQSSHTDAPVRYPTRGYDERPTTNDSPVSYPSRDSETTKHAPPTVPTRRPAPSRRASSELAPARPTRQHSPSSKKKSGKLRGFFRKPLSRHHSEPVTPQQPLKLPHRRSSPKKGFWRKSRQSETKNCEAPRRHSSPIRRVSPPPVLTAPVRRASPPRKREGEGPSSPDVAPMRKHRSTALTSTAPQSTPVQN